MEKKNAIDFLLYSYFGVTTDSDWKKCVEAAIMKAYNDATMQGAYNALIPKENDDLHKKSDEAKKEAATLIKARIKELFTNYIGSFGNWHSELCNEIKNKYSDVNSENTLFTYGNAQKWVNMTIKYICILGLLNDNNDYQDKIKNYMDDFHVPVDSYIIDELWGNPNIKLPSISSNVKREKTYTTPSDYVISWSNWTDKNYGDFREKLDKTYNLQWEGKAWIEQAEKRKEKEKQAKRNSFFK